MDVRPSHGFARSIETRAETKIVLQFTSELSHGAVKLAELVEPRCREGHSGRVRCVSPSDGAHHDPVRIAWSAHRRGSQSRPRQQFTGRSINSFVAAARNFHCYAHVFENFGKRSLPNDHAAVRVVIQKRMARCNQDKRILSCMSKHIVFCSILKNTSVTTTNILPTPA